MTRVSTFGQQDVLLQQLLKNQRAVFEDQRKISTGLKAQDIAGLARDAPALLAAKSRLSELESLKSTNLEVSLRLDLYNINVGETANIAQTLRDDVFKAVSLNSGIGLEGKLEQLFEQTAAILNHRDQGKYIFGGTRIDTPPYSANSVTDFLALADPDDGFQNNNTKLSATIDEGVTLEVGVLADDLASALMQAFYRLFQFNSGTLPSGAGAFAPAGPFQDPMTTNQRDFLIGELTNIEAAITAARSEESNNGVKIQRISELQQRQEEDIVFTTNFISEIQDADITEAITNLNNDQVALEASLQVLARLNQVTLLNFI